MDAVVRHALTRRRLLGLGVGLGGLTFVAGTGAAYTLWPRPAAAGRVVLSSTEEAVVAAVADAYLPPNNPFGVAAAAVDIAGGVDAYIASLPDRPARLMRSLLVAVEQWPRFSWSSVRRFSELTRSERMGVLESFETSRLRERQQLAGVLRLLVAVPFFEDERVLAAAGIQFGCPVIP